MAQLLLTLEALGTELLLDHVSGLHNVICPCPPEAAISFDYAAEAAVLAYFNGDAGDLLAMQAALG